MRIAFITYVLGVLSYFISINANLVAYFEYLVNYDFIVQNLCVQKDEPINTCHGHCHLRKNLEKVEENNGTKERKNVELKTNVKIENHRLTSTVCNLIPNITSLIFYNFNVNYLIKPFVEKNDPPPRQFSF